jgi:hypothetical protein
MGLNRTAFTALWLIGCCLLLSATGCCSRRGYLLHGDWSLELNRVPWRDDNCGAGGGCAAGSGAEGEYAAGGAVEVGSQPRARFHPVPTRNVFTPEPTAETIPAPAPTEVRQSSHLDGGSPAPHQNIPVRYARKAKCGQAGSCSSTTNVEAVDSEPGLEAEPQIAESAVLSPTAPKARLSSAWKAAPRR